MAEAIDFGVDQVNSTVLEVAESFAREHNLVLSSEAKYRLLEAAKPQLNEALSRGVLEQRRSEAEETTKLLMQEVVQFHQRSGVETPEITWGMVDGALESLCSKFKYLYPVCPRK